MSQSPEMSHASSHAAAGIRVDDNMHHHVCSKRTFGVVYVALVFLTILTVAVSRLDFGSFNLFIALAVAALKASLVMAVFMHLRWDTAINNIVILSSFLFLSLLFLFTLADFATRGDADPVLEQRSAEPKPTDETQRKWFAEGHGH
jgi:cytochrome c oxidase subunit 4